MESATSRIESNGNRISTHPFEMFRAIQGSGLGLWHRDLLSGKMCYSDRWRSMLGMGPGGIGDDRADFLEHVHPDDREAIETGIMQHTATNTPAYECEFRMQHTDGTFRWIRSCGMAFRDQDGKAVAIAGTHEDITWRRNLEQFYLQLLDAFPGFVWVKNERLEFEFTNEKLANAYGTTREEAIGKNDYFFNRNIEQAEQFVLDDKNVLESGKVLRVDEVLTDSKGVDHHMETVKMPLPPIAGWKNRGKFVMGFAVDVTGIVELQQAREDLRQQQWAMRNLMDNVPDGIFFKDRNHCLVRANNALAILVGRTSGEEIVGMSDWDLLQDEEYARLAWEEEEELLRTGKAVRDIRMTPLKSGTQYRLVTKVPIRNAAGEIVEICGISKDVTDLIALQQTLREEREQINQVLNNLPQPIFVKDEAGRYLRCNKAWAERHGEPNPEAAVGKTDFDYSSMEQAESFRRIDQEVLRDDTAKRFREKLILSDGKVRVLQTLKLPLHDETGRPVNVLGLYEDVTDRIDEEKLQFNKDAARTIGHCLKNRMKVVFDNVDEIKARYPFLEIDTAFLRLERSTDYLRHAAELATRIATLDAVTTSEPFQVNDAIQSVVDSIKDDRIAFLRAQEAPVCRGSRTHFENAALELLANARYYAPRDGHIEVRVRLEGGNCIVDFEDDGDGVREDLQRIVFDFFAAGEPNRTGMGLGYAKWVCQQCGGDISLLPPGASESRLCGAHFVMTLPDEGGEK